MQQFVLTICTRSCICVSSVTGYPGFPWCFHPQGDNEKALEFFQKSLAIRKKVYKGDHPKIATALNNIGSLYKAMVSTNVSFLVVCVNVVHAAMVTPVPPCPVPSEEPVVGRDWGQNLSSACTAPRCV